jgi:hypothetical protein
MGGPKLILNTKNQSTGRINLVDEIGTFAAIPTSFIEDSAHLSAKAKWLFVVLRSYTNNITGQAFPSYDAMQKRTGFRRQAISDSLKELERAGWLERKQRFSKSSIYTLKIPTPITRGGDTDAAQSSTPSDTRPDADTTTSPVVDTRISPDGDTHNSPQGDTLTRSSLTRSKRTNQPTRSQGSCRADSSSLSQTAERDPDAEWINANAGTAEDDLIEAEDLEWGDDQEDHAPSVFDGRELSRKTHQKRRPFQEFPYYEMLYDEDWKPDWELSDRRWIQKSMDLGFSEIEVRAKIRAYTGNRNRPDESYAKQEHIVSQVFAKAVSEIEAIG